MSIPPRQRIVINLDEPSGSPRKRRPYQPLGQSQPKQPRRWPKILGILVLVFLVIGLVAAAGGYFWWRHFQTTPVYSLAVLIDAAQRNDGATVDRLTNSDKVIGNLAEQMIDKVSGQLGFVSGYVPSGVLSQSAGLHTLPPSVVETLKQTFRERVTAEIKDFSAQSAPKPFIILALTLPNMIKVTSTDNTARMTATVRGQPVELTMEKEAGVWKVVGIKDDNFVTRLVSELVNDLPRPKVNAIEPGKRQNKRRR